MSGETIHVGKTAAPFQGFADYLNGEVAVVHRVELSMDEHIPALLIHPPDRDPVVWPLDRIRTIPDQADRANLVITIADRPLARLVISDPDVMGVLRARCRHLRHRPPVKGKGRLAVWALGAVASVALIVMVLVPLMADQLAELLPPEGEKALGDTTFEQIRQAMDPTGFGLVETCENPAGKAALAKMQARLMEGYELPYELTVHVLSDDLVNAFALPGGYVVFFDGLIQAAEGPDEVAAVFAHEIGHVANRDPTRIALRTAGSIGVLGLLFGDFAGGAVILFLTERLVQANYTQEAEAGADAFAHQRLREVGIPPSALGGLFRTLRDEYGETEGIVAHFASHPQLGDRIAAAEAASAGMGQNTRPSLTREEWQDLRNICDR